MIPTLIAGPGRGMVPLTHLCPAQPRPAHIETRSTFTYRPYGQRHQDTGGVKATTDGHTVAIRPSLGPDVGLSRANRLPQSAVRSFQAAARPRRVRLSRGTTGAGSPAGETRPAGRPSGGGDGGDSPLGHGRGRAPSARARRTRRQAPPESSSSLRARSHCASPLIVVRADATTTSRSGGLEHRALAFGQSRDRITRRPWFHPCGTGGIHDE